ncbi:MAG TPA: hypothetical protein VHP33_41345 [Polyangiaceae bacterium]|nr:hypothetical protein [Polyangiaceae bacterium]
MKFLLLTALAAPPAPAPATAPAPAPVAAAAPAPAASVYPLRLTLASTSAFGVTHAKFFNQLLGARVDRRFTPRFAFGAALSYANLKGKDGRAHNTLLEVFSEYRAPIKQEAFGLPLRFALGYLPNNGPTLRFGAGFDFAISDRISCEITPLESMVWLTRERPEISMNGSVALRIGF